MPEIPGGLSNFDSTTKTIFSSSECSRVTSTRQLRSWAKILLLIAVFLPPISAFVILYRQEFPVPYQDDYAAVLSFAQEYSQLPDWRAKAIHILTKQGNDYKLAFAHSVIASDLELSGHLNFPFLIFLGNFCLLPIAYLLWRNCPSGPDCRLDQRLILFLPISLMFFSLVYWETLDWCTPGLQNLPVILFSLLSITLLIPRVSENTRLVRGALAGLSAALAALSSANGFLLAPIGLVVLLPRRAFAAATLWCASFLIPIASYLYHYTPYSYSFQLIHSRSWLAKASFSFAFLGCALPNRWAALLLGITFTIVFGLSIRSRFYRKQPVLFYFTLWVLATAVLVGSMRGTVAPRYSIYSILALIFAYSFLSEQLPGWVHPLTLKRLHAAALVCALLFCIAGDVIGYWNLGERRQMVLTGIEQYRANPEMNSPMIDPRVLVIVPGEAEYERWELTRALRNHLLVLPPRQGSR